MEAVAVVGEQYCRHNVQPQPSQSAEDLLVVLLEEKELRPAAWRMRMEQPLLPV